jgi:hypothetical protein
MEEENKTLEENVEKYDTEQENKEQVNLELDEETLRKIKEESLSEYSDMVSTKQSKGWATTLLLMGILILAILIVKNISDTTNTIANMSTDEQITIKIDEEGNIVE